MTEFNFLALVVILWLVWHTSQQLLLNHIYGKSRNTAPQQYARWLSFFVFAPVALPALLIIGSILGKIQNKDITTALSGISGVDSNNRIELKQRQMIARVINTTLTLIFSWLVLSWAGMPVSISIPFWVITSRESSAKPQPSHRPEEQSFSVELAAQHGAVWICILTAPAQATDPWVSEEQWQRESILTLTPEDGKTSVQINVDPDNQLYVRSGIMGHIRLTINGQEHKIAESGPGHLLIKQQEVRFFPDTYPLPALCK